MGARKVKKQATRANQAQIEQHIKRQQAGLKSDFAIDHPILDALITIATIAVAVGGMLAAWVYVGAGLSLAP